MGKSNSKPASTLKVNATTMGDGSYFQEIDESQLEEPIFRTMKTKKKVSAM